MFNKRVFKEENLDKINRLFDYLYKNDLPYCVSYEYEIEVETPTPIAVVSWYS